jgi:hypothetical protein
MFKTLESQISQTRASFMEGFYAVHVRVRYLHDAAYQRGGVYKRWTDTPYSHAVHRAVILSFFISFVIFSTIHLLTYVPAFRDLLKNIPFIN